MLRRFTLPWLSALVLSAACASDGPTGAVPDASLLVRSAEAGISASASGNTSAGRPVARPIGGHCTTDIHSTIVGPQSLLFDMTGSCILSHLGRVTIVIHQECWFGGDAAGTCDNTTTLTAANGDTLKSTWHSDVGENESDGCHATFAGRGIYDGGTGRFAGATGVTSAQGTASCDPATGAYTGQYTTTGTISY